MNVKEAKRLNLPAILEKLGYKPVRETKNGNELWYLSPFRTEHEPSFHTSFIGGKWIWNDFGDSGGTVIDFVMRHENFSSVKQALGFLKRLDQHNFSFQPPKKAKPIQRELELLSVEAITNPVILDYLTKQRALDKAICITYLQEIYYRNKNTGKTYFGFGMQNESGGYEVRVASDQYPFKSALVKKDISLIKAEPEAVHIFEGMTDFLSLLTIRKLEGASIIMHSLSSFQRTVDVIRQNGYQQIYTYLDNNKAGREHTEKFQAEFDDKVLPQNELYKGHEDVNAYLKATAAASV